MTCNAFPDHEVVRQASPLRVTCPVCEAVPGEHCRTAPPTQRYVEPHARRVTVHNRTPLIIRPVPCSRRAPCVRCRRGRVL